MKNLLLCAFIVSAASAGWFAVALHTPAAAPSVKLEPITHAPYDPAAIDRNLVLHKARVQRDPGGPIGWSMLAESWLARSRESDDDSAAWAAEAAARRSLALRTDGNSRAKSDLVDSLLEQHRFQDARATLEAFHFPTRQYGDVLIEMGELDAADRILAALPMQNEDPALIASRSRVALLRGDTSQAIAGFEKALRLSEGNPGVSDPTIAWFTTKLADAVRRSGDSNRAEELLHHALDLNPRSYKANLALAEISAERKDWPNVIRYSEATLKIANSLDAHAMIGDAYRAMGRDADSVRVYDGCYRQYMAEVASFDAAGHGGKWHVKPIDRQFATFCVRRLMYLQDGLAAAKRDYANRPDATAKANLKALQSEMGR